MKTSISFLVILLLTSGVVNALPNPAVWYCRAQGYSYENGMCIFPDGSACSAHEYLCNCEPDTCLPGSYSCHWPCKELPCRQAGQDVYHGISECCGGLQELYPPGIFDDDCDELGMIGWLFLCSDCGNGICEDWESKCNCPQDCLCPDDDGDGHSPAGGDCGPVDCDDSDPNVYPGAPEMCDGLDNDCNPATPDGYDEWWIGQPCDGLDWDLCKEGVFQCHQGELICSDETAGNVEVCDDGLDNDCDGEVDEGCESIKHDLLERYSPVLYRHPDEQYFPRAIESMLKEADLEKYRALPECSRLTVKHHPEASDLDSRDPNYYLSLIETDPDTFEEYDLTVYGRACRKEHHSKSYVVLQYWFFYPYNDGPLLQDHEGDWEMIQLVFYGDYGDALTSNPTNVTYSYHLWKKNYEWPEIETIDDTHPKVFVAKGSHASYKDTHKLPLAPLEEISNLGTRLVLRGLDVTVDGTVDYYELRSIGDQTSWALFEGRWGYVYLYWDPDVLTCYTMHSLGLDGPTSPGRKYQWDHPLEWAGITARFSQGPANIATIRPDASLQIPTIMDSTVESVEFRLSWSGSDLDLVLKTPGGALIDPVYALENNITFVESETFEYYVIENPEPGLWEMEITPVNVPTEGEMYTVTVYLATDLILLSEADRQTYSPGEHISLAARVDYNDILLTDVDIQAEITKPDYGMDVVQLYDDGLHNDSNGYDGIYGNTYLDTSQEGTYTIKFVAIGASPERFYRETSTNVNVRSLADLMPIGLVADGGPVEGQMTLITTIMNSGTEDANDILVQFCDVNDVNVIRIDRSETIGYLEPRETKELSVVWEAPHGIHNLFVVVDPLDEISEEDEGNNYLKKSFCIGSKPEGDVNNDCVVNFLDLDQCVNYWLTACSVQTCWDCCDVDESTWMDLGDFALIAEHWLENLAP